MKLGLIGSAGRGEDYKKLSKDKWREVYLLVKNFVIEHKITSLVSGGAAFSDHLAVLLYHHWEEQIPLELELPAKFENGKFEDGGFKSPGNTANYYHKRYSEMIGRDSLSEIQKAIDKGAAVTVGDGFFARNKIVAAKADILLAITFGNKEVLKDSGTAHTTKEFIRLKGNQWAFHLDLNLMKIFPGAIVK